MTKKRQSCATLADLFAAFGCSNCHQWYDNKANDSEERLFYFHRAMKRTWAIWIKSGIIEVSGVDAPDL